ncbi:MAG: hypothetical protein R3Y64_08780 [Peptostreptococcaceae bacterium]
MRKSERIEICSSALIGQAIYEQEKKRDREKERLKKEKEKKSVKQSELFSKAHQLTFEIVEKYDDVDYKEQFKLCLEMVIEDSKNEVDFPELLIKEYGGSKWEKGDMSRIYFGNTEDLENLCERFDVATSNYFDECKFFYDLNHEEFACYSLNRRKKGQKELRDLCEKMMELKSA